ncbi:hypothetical protein EVAR_88853_1 [Eumeta japonica]|uniref:Uncharacterized protein n=1 Tax=Eumeta variegata TaxID=151549 RepID=A0A4C1Y455_EUMVA|nr:hypothetical protein EVAR_88853_1 [Eumeta japonica]
MSADIKRLHSKRGNHNRRTETHRTSPWTSPKRRVRLLKLFDYLPNRSPPGRVAARGRAQLKIDKVLTKIHSPAPNFVTAECTPISQAHRLRGGAYSSGEGAAETADRPPAAGLRRSLCAGSLFGERVTAVTEVRARAHAPSAPSR